LPDIFVAASSSKKKKPVQKKEEKSKAAERKKAVVAVVRQLDKNLAKVGHHLSTFATFPDGVAFETQQLEEPIVLLLRRHWITNLPWICLTILMIVAPLLLRFTQMLIFFPANFQIIFVVLWYLLTLSFVFEKFLGWFFNVYIITDERVVDVDFYSLTYKQISDAGLNKIQDITYRTRGVVGSIINYGHILIQTAGNQPNIQFEDVPRPAEVVRILNELITQEEQDMLDGRAR